MARNSGKPSNREREGLDADLDALFQLPLAEFTAARNTLAAQLKKSGQGGEAEFVKTLVKPSISAWTVNQLYWKHRQAFERLIESGESFHQAQTSRGSGKVADMREALDARRKSLLSLSDLASALLRDAGHNPTQDTVRRITTTLEAMSVYASLPDGPRPGRLTQDVDPPGFESLASFIPSGRTSEPSRTVDVKKASHFSPKVAKGAQQKAEAASETRDVEKLHRANIAAAKASLQEAKSLLTEARTKAQSLETAQRKAQAAAKDAEKESREAEARFKEARAAAEDATRNARNTAGELAEARKAFEDAKRAVEKTSKELEKLFRNQ